MGGSLTIVLALAFVFFLYQKLFPADTSYSRGLARLAQGDNAGALADFTEALKLKPRSAEAYNGRGSARSAQGDNAGALTDYTEALKLKPSFAHAYYNRGNARQAQRDKAGAIADYQKAADLYLQQGQTSDYQDALGQIKKLQ